jgi:hypothetical protein
VTQEIGARWSAIARAAEGEGDLDAAIADLYRMQADVPGRSYLAAGLLRVLMQTNTYASLNRPRDVERLLAIADDDPPAGPTWRRTRAAVRALVLMQLAIDQRLTDPRAALRELDELERSAVGEPGPELVIATARPAIELLRALREGDEAAIRDMPSGVARLREQVAHLPDSGTVTDALAVAVDLMAAHRRGGDVWEHMEQLKSTVDKLPAGHPLHAALADATVMAAPLRGLMGAEPGAASAVSDADVAALEARARAAGLSDADRVAACAVVAGVLLRGGVETDRARVDRAITWMRAALDVRVTDAAQRAVYLQGLALGLFRRSELTNARADLDEAAGLLEEARTLAGGPQHPMWAAINEMLSYTESRGGAAPSAARRTSLEGLRGHVWRVLTQSDLSAASLAARDAAEHAVAAARGFLRDNQPAEALAALDAGRGLALFAATEQRNVAHRLREAGLDDLAERWRVAAARGDPAQLSGELRHEVLAALAGHSSAARLLDAPSVVEVRDALATIDADVLVYLVPGEQAWPGFAVTVPRDGPPGFASLPNLVVDKDVELERYLKALDTRDGAHRELEPRPGRTFEDCLATLCDWAWRAAIGPLLERYLPSVHLARADRPPRVVLIPMGTLSRVPWHAARRGDGAYAIELAAFSMAPSARMLCRSAAADPVLQAPVGLVVGDPDTRRPGQAQPEAPDLLAARLEAYAVHRSLYPGGRYVGRRPDGRVSPSGAGTRSDVRDWLTSGAPGVGGTLHLACHGVVRPGAGTSYLLLAGGERLTAEELIGLMETAPERTIGLVVLAACRTAQSVTGYDEAYSLGTAFLAGGARSVLSTQWSIPDRDTSVLMFMFHHLLIAEHRPAWDALRRAQLWMLDANRVVPTGMPPRLRQELDGSDPSAVVSWAGFIHSGQ